MSISSSTVGAWIAESMTNQLIGSAASYFMGLALADFGPQTPDQKIEALLAEIQEEMEEVLDMLKNIADFQQLQNLSLACTNLKSSIETVERYYKEGGKDTSVVQTDLENIENAISALDTAFITSSNDEESGVVALANWHFNNLGNNSTSVCELLYANLQHVWGLRGKGVYTINWASNQYNNPLAINLDTLVPNCLSTIASQAATVQKLVDADFSLRQVNLTAAVASVSPMNNSANGTVSSVSAFTWFGFQNPSNPVTSQTAMMQSGDGYTYDIPWAKDSLYGPTGDGYQLPGSGSGAPNLVYRPAAGYFGTEMAAAAAHTPVVGIGFCVLGNELCAGVALKTNDGATWNSVFGMSTSVTVLNYTESDNQPDTSAIANNWATGLCEFEDGDYLNGWANIPRDAPHYSQKSKFNKVVNMTSQVNTTEGDVIVFPFVTYTYVYGGYWDQRLVGPSNMGEGLALPITGVCFVIRGNRFGYLAQCRIHQNEFDTPPFGGAQTISAIEAYITANQ